MRDVNAIIGRADGEALYREGGRAQSRRGGLAGGLPIPLRRDRARAARQCANVAGLFTAHCAVVFSPSPNVKVRSIVEPTLSGCFGFSSIT